MKMKRLALPFFLAALLCAAGFNFYGLQGLGVPTPALETQVVHSPSGAPYVAQWATKAAFLQEVEAATRTIFISGHITGAGGETESALSDENTFACLLENPTDSGSETGLGAGLSGVDLVLTQAGSISGATTVPPTRILEIDDTFTVTQNFTDTFFSTDATWTIIVKVNPAVIAGSRFPFFCSDGLDDYLYVEGDVTGLYFRDMHNGVDKLYALTAAKPPIGADCYIAMWSDGTYIRGGWTTVSPTKWSDFAANNRVTATVAHLPLDPLTARTMVGRAGNQTMPGAYSYVRVSTECLIDNAL